MAVRFSPSNTRIGWIGTGVMGAPMCGHLMDAGYAATVYTRTQEKARSLLQRGAAWADSPAALAAQVEVIFTMVGYPEDVRAVYFGDRGVLAGARRDCVAVDMTSTRPALAVEIHEAGSGAGVATVDAPVSGGDVGARNAALAIMIGGDEQVVSAIMPLLKLLGKNIVYQGGPGAGQHTKLCNQIVIASTMVGVCESLLYGYKAGLNLETMLQSISSGAAGCWTLDNLAPRILKRNFDPGFFVDHFVKDMGIGLEEARRMNIQLPGLELAHRLYGEVQKLGHGQCGTHALMLALEAMSETEPPPTSTS